MKFQLDLHPHSEYISNFYRKNNYWEKYVTEVLIELFKKYGSTHIFIDIGANIGYFSLLAASYGVETHAFEPIKENLKLFRSSIDKNNYNHLIKVYDFALSDNDIPIQMNISYDNMGLSSTRVFPDINYTEKVNTKTFDQVFEYNMIPMIVKIDVEHMEDKVLYGMSKLLKYVTHIIIEISEVNKHVLDFLKKNGFNEVINIGFDEEEAKGIDFNSTHLDMVKYESKIDMLNFNDYSQIMVLFIKYALKGHLKSKFHST